MLYHFFLAADDEFSREKELKTLVREALELCISELDELPQPLLDTVLIQLLPVTKNENPASYSLAKVLLLPSLVKTCPEELVGV